MGGPRPANVRGKWCDGEWYGKELEFRETFEYLDDPEEDIDGILRSCIEEYGHKQDSYASYLDSDYWQGVRMKALSAAGNKCRCGKTENLQVHHKRYCARYTEHLNLHLLEVVCPACHAQEHGEVAG